jgi:hypothetical protein
MRDPNQSPVGWYVGSYILRFVELDESGNHDEESEFLVWENTILIKAENISEAYDKLETEANEHTEPYKGGEEGVPFQWIYEGITELVPIYDKIEDGAEIMYAEYHNKLKRIKKKVLSKDDIIGHSSK